ncbi:MAG TPA: hypothetical protein VN081_00560 [Dongiaceae bacterium]|nr:hypothetical protein [Dongiaceae bacterium]
MSRNELLNRINSELQRRLSKVGKHEWEHGTPYTRAHWGYGQRTMKLVEVGVVDRVVLAAHGGFGGMRLFIDLQGHLYASTIQCNAEGEVTGTGIHRCRLFSHPRIELRQILTALQRH